MKQPVTNGYIVGPGAIWTLIAAGLAQAVPAAAETFNSSYTSAAPKDCRRISSDERICRGMGKLWVLVGPAEGDFREAVSVGRNRAAAAAEPAARMTFGPFNSSGETVEWRAVDGKPFAIIQRWYIADISDEDKDGRPINKQVLVVTRLPPGSVCHVAYIDVKANPDANALARRAADTIARNFDCDEEGPRIVGVSGRGTELAGRKGDDRIHWSGYGNARFNYRIDIPPEYTEVDESGNGDGGISHGLDGRAELSIWGQYLIDGSFTDNAKWRLEQDRKDGWTVTYEKSQPQWAVRSGTKGARIFYERGIPVCNGAAAFFRIEYDKGWEKAFDPIIARLAKSLRSGEC
ncbi:MAG: hypothetical protein LBV50_06005 [Novosphingobium sp.]|jgi:hypothetical protein|nr:hypothetical protein [Novosphingobium sp.]